MCYVIHSTIKSTCAPPKFINNDQRAWCSMVYYSFSPQNFHKVSIISLNNIVISPNSCKYPINSSQNSQVQ